MIAPQIPTGPAWGVAVLLGMLLKDAVRALVQRRNGTGNSKIGERLARLETKIDSNIEEVGRLRAWRHDDLQQQLQSIEGRLGNIMLDVQELRGGRR